MDAVFDYKRNLISYLKSMDDDQKVVITIDQLFYLILSENPCNNSSLLYICKKIFGVVNSNNLSSNISGLKKLFEFASKYGLSDEINNEIYDLLVVDQLIIKNNEVLAENYDITLFNMNSGLKENYNIKRQDLISKILSQ